MDQNLLPGVVVAVACLFFWFFALVGLLFLLYSWPTEKVGVSLILLSLCSSGVGDCRCRALYWAVAVAAWF